MKVITIGRSSDNDVPVNDSKVSRHHLQIIQHDDGSYTLSDFGSTNGTYVNGKRVRGEINISPNDIVRIGNTTLRWNIYFKDESSSPPVVDTPDYEDAEIEDSLLSQKSETRSVVWIFISLLIVGVILVLAFVWLFNRGDNNTPSDPWRYENGVRTNVPGASHNTSWSEQPHGTQSYEHELKDPSPSGFSDVDLTGTWVWENDGNSFELTLSRSDEGRIVGGYCALWGTSRMDCDEENWVEENRTRDKIVSNTAMVKFSSAAWGGSGTALITKLSDYKIKWELRNTDDECLVPDEAILLRK